MSQNSGRGADPRSKWRVRVSGKAYGPYAIEQIKSYIIEGRILPHSILSPNDSEDWRKAADHPVIAMFFDERKKSAAPERAATAAEQAPTPTATSKAAPTPAPAEPAIREPRAQNDNASRLILITELVMENPSLDQEIMTLGTAYKLAPNVWLIKARMSVTELRDRLARFFGEDDRLFIADATNGDAVSFNQKPATDEKLARIWS